MYSKIKTVFCNSWVLDQDLITGPLSPIIRVLGLRGEVEGQLK